jgi:hypothetical protein
VPAGFSALVLGASLLLVAGGLEKSPQRSLAEFAYLIALCWFNAGLFDRVAIAAAADWAALLTGASVMSAAYGLHKDGRQLRLSGLGYLIGKMLEVVILSALSATGSVFLGILIYIAGIVLAMYAGAKLSGAVYTYIADGVVDRHWQSAKSAVTSFFKPTLVAPAKAA